MANYHIPVLLEESISALITNPDGTYADATFGGGGHTAAILSRLHDGGRVIAFDRDIDAIQHALKDPRLTLIHNNFRFIENYAAMLEAGQGPFERERCSAACPAKRQGIPSSEAVDGEHAVFDGILADLGVSSHQFDTEGRGFSFRFEEDRLDMRMNQSGKLTAEEVVNTYAEEELERIFRLWGEVDNARAVARLIVRERALKAIGTTGELDRAVEKTLPRGAEHKALAKIYQALRIEVNQEMRSLEKFLEGAARCLKPDGRLVVITYHSLEDRMVKNYIRTGNVDGREVKDVFGRTNAPLEALNRKPVVPEESEIAGNTRARSAKLRTARRRDWR